MQNLSKQKNNVLGYNGNSMIKRDGVNHGYSQEEVAEYIKCSRDPKYFIENYCKVVHQDHGLIDFEMYPYQKDMIDDYESERFTIVRAARQSGKTALVAVYILWFAIFNPDKTAAILANKGATAREILSRCVIALENLPFFLQPGCRGVNKGSLVFSNGSKIVAASTSSSSIRGLSVALLYMDEFAFVENDYKFFESTYPVITSAKTSRVIITSTPNGVGNMFYKLFEGSLQGVNSFKNMTVTWEAVPGRDQAWKEETIANTSPQQFRQEFDVEFVGSSNTLINPDKLIALVAKKPIRVNRDETLKIYHNAEENHQYIIPVDVSMGRGQDYSTFSVIDVTEKPFKQVCTFRDSLISPLLFPVVIVQTAQQYNDALVIVENNSIGQVVCNGIYYDLEYENMFVESMVKAGGIGVTQTKKTKRIGCSNLKDLIETDCLLIDDHDTIDELSSFVVRGNSYEAQGTCHDDTVMCLVVFSWFVATPAFTDFDGLDFKEMLYKDRQYEIEQDMMGIGFLTSKSNDVNIEYEIMKDDIIAWRNL